MYNCTCTVYIDVAWSCLPDSSVTCISVTCTKSWVGYNCTCDVGIAFPYLRNGWAHWADIWCVISDPFTMRFTKSWVGYTCTCARAHPFSIFRERLDAICWNFLIGKKPISHAFYTSHEWGLTTRLHVRTLFHISGTAGCIGLKFGVWWRIR